MNYSASHKSKGKYTSIYGSTDSIYQSNRNPNDSNMVPKAQKEEDDSNVEENKIRSHKKSRPSPSRSSNKEFKAHDNRVTIQDTSDHNHTSAMRTGAHYHLHRGNTWFTNVFDHDFNTTHHSKKPESSNGSQDLRVESRDKISNKTSAYSKKPKVGAITSS